MRDLIKATLHTRVRNPIRKDEERVRAVGKDKEPGNGEKECWGRGNSVELGAGDGFFVFLVRGMNILSRRFLRYASRNFRTHSVQSRVLFENFGNSLKLLFLCELFCIPSFISSMYPLDKHILSMYNKIETIQNILSKRR